MRCKTISETPHLKALRFVIALCPSHPLSVFVCLPSEHTEGLAVAVYSEVPGATGPVVQGCLGRGTLSLRGLEFDHPQPFTVDLRPTASESVETGGRQGEELSSCGTVNLSVVKRRYVPPRGAAAPTVEPQPGQSGV